VGFATERLALRVMGSDDLDLLADLNRDADVMKFITGRASSIEETAAELMAALGTRWLALAASTASFSDGSVRDRRSSETTAKSAGVFKRFAWGNGYATEAAREPIDHLFAHGARRVFAQTMAINARSRAVMERLGLRLCRTFHLDVIDPLPGTELGEVEYELACSAWRRQRRDRLV
jgi:RimJ/RimL family protein N-acetyltransferase